MLLWGCLCLIIILTRIVVSKKGYLTPIFKNKYSKRSQTYDEMYASNGTFIWHRTKSFLDKKYLGHYVKI